jgi:hypothetical protein
MFCSLEYRTMQKPSNVDTNPLWPELLVVLLTFHCFSLASSRCNLLALLSDIFIKLLLFLSYPCNRPVKAHKVVRRRGSNIFSKQSAHRWRWGCQPYAPAALYPPRRFLVLISVRGWVDPRVIVRLEGICKLKKKSTSSGLETATFRLVA